MEGNEMRQLKFYIGIFLLLVVGLAGCKGDTKKQSQDIQKKSEKLEGMVFAAQFDEVKAPVFSSFQSCWMGNNLVYSEQEQHEESGKYYTMVLRVPLDASKEPEVIAGGTKEKENILLFFTDSEESLFLLGGRDDKGNVTTYFLEKQNLAGEVVYRKELGEELAIRQPGLLSSGYADSEGNVVFWGWDGQVLFFDKEAKYIGTASTELMQVEVLDAGEDGIFIWERDWTTGEVRLEQLDMKQGTLKAAKKISTKDILESIYDNFSIISGYEKGTLISTSKGLWHYDLGTQKSNLILDWSIKTIDIDGSTVKQIKNGDWTIDNMEGMEALLMDTQDSVSEVITITTVDASKLPEKKVITLGCSEYSYLDRIVRSFNRNSLEYEIQLQTYDNDKLMEAMMYGKEEIPDMIDISWITPEILANMELLENLEPYFANSVLVHKEDILDAVWQAGIIKDKMVGATLGFHISSIDTTVQDISPKGWTIDELFALESKYPDSKVLEYYYPHNMWRIAMEAQMDRFIDFEEGKCYFNSEAFLSILEQMGSLTFQKEEETTGSGIYHLDDEVNNMLSGEFSLRFSNFSSPYDYQTFVQKYEGDIKSVGYPSADGEPWFIMSPTQQLSIYSGSENKDGAWAFIEYLLSSKQQDWYGESSRGFPIRKDCFDAYLDKPYSQTRQFVGDNPNPKCREEIQHMVEHMHLGQTGYNYTIMRIIYTELQSFITGAKTAKEAADIMQNRIELYLREM